MFLSKKTPYKALILFSMIIVFTVITASSTAYAYVSADNRIAYYQQTREAAWTGSQYDPGYWDSQLDTIGSGIQGDLSDRGCGLFTFAHAIQWLTGNKLQTDNELISLLSILASKNDDPPSAQASKDYVEYILSEETYKEHNIEDITSSLPRNWEAVKRHFDNGGVIIFAGDGHYSLAIGYTEKEIDGENMQLIQVVDSQIRSRAKRVSTSFSWDFSKCYKAHYDANQKKYVFDSTQPDDSEYGQMWITYSDLEAKGWRACLTSTTSKSLSSSSHNKTFIAHERSVYSVNKAAIKESPASDSKTLRTASGEITIVAIYQNTEDKSVWYQLEDGGYVCMSDATFVRSLLDIKTSEVQAPMGELQAGNSFGLRGIIHTNCSIYKITGEILQDGQVIDSAVYFPKATELDINIRYTPINNDLEFGDLPAGDYIYRVSVQLGYLLDGGPCIGPSGGVIESAFTVVKPDPPSNPDIPDSPTATPSVSPTATPTATPTVSPTITPTSTPTVSPTITPTATPIVSPNITPTAAPTATTTVTPTVAPTTVPSPSPEPIAPPKTGDNTPLPIYLVMLVIATAGLLILNWHKSKA